MIAPPCLRAGDRIGVVAPSGPVTRRLVSAGARVLERHGFRVVLGRHLFGRRGHLAGSDDARADDLNRMLRDPDVRCVLMARGGFGAIRIADRVDWQAMRRDPKVYAGYSDATFLHLAFARHAGVRTLHGPNLHDLATLDASGLRRWLAWLTEREPDRLARTIAAPRTLGRSRRPARGPVLGGNLALVHYAAGTPHLPRLRGAILFLEEVNEPPYKIDGMLAHLGLTGALSGLGGVALGSFAGCVPRRGRKELSLRTVLVDHLGAGDAPVLAGIRAGHGRPNLPFPLGARATLDPRRGRLIFDEGLVS